MSNYTFRIKNSAKPDLKKIKQFSLTAQFQKIVETLKEDPYLPTQSFEKLKPTQAGRDSRRLNRQHRVVYKVKEERIVEIYSAWTHYE